MKNYTVTQRRLLAILDEPGGFGSESGGYVWAASDLTDDPVRFNYSKTFLPLLNEGLVEFRYSGNSATFHLSKRRQ